MSPAGDEPEHDARPDLHVVGDSDGELLGRIAERDHEAFEVLYRRYVRPVYGLALRRLSDCERAEHATRRAFAAIWRSATSYVPGPDGGARWMFAIARDAVIDDERARRPPRPGPEAVSEEGWLTFRVHVAVAELPEHERVPLELVYWGGRSQSEIAELLGLPVGTVESRTRSALARLAVRVEDSDDRNS